MCFDIIIQRECGRSGDHAVGHVELANALEFVLRAYLQLADQHVLKTILCQQWKLPFALCRCARVRYFTLVFLQIFVFFLVQLAVLLPLHCSVHMQPLHNFSNDHVNIN